MAEYQARFLNLERFVPGSFSNEREQAAQLASGLRNSITSVVATFSCLTLGEAVMRALGCEPAMSLITRLEVEDRAKDKEDRTIGVHDRKGDG